MTLRASHVAEALTGAGRWLRTGVVPDGAWFRGLCAAHLRARVDRRWDLPPGETADARGEREIRRAAQKAAIASGLAAAGVTGGALAVWLTEGIAAPVGIPAALLAVVLDAAYTALLGIDLVCDLGALHGARFLPGDPEAVAAVFADALHIDGGPGTLAPRVGRKLMARAFARDLVPVANLAAGAAASYRTILAVGAAATRRVRGG
jgi:hypothetical protein